MSLYDDDNEPLTGELLIESLDKLRDRLVKSGVNRTMGLKSYRGRDCAWYLKSVSHFLKMDYLEIRNLIKEAYDLIQKCEEEDGRR
jgi:hypothetical protein